MTKTIKLFNSAGQPLTKITSSDETVTLPTEITLDSEGTATACHADSGDQEYVTLHDLCAAYAVSIESVMAECETVEHNDEKLILVQDAYRDQDYVHVEPRRCYRAAAIDATGNQYRVTWYPHEDFDGDDESNACDWECPDRIDRL